MAVDHVSENQELNLSTPIGPLHDPVTWYGVNYAGTQVTQWDFQNKGKSGWTGTTSFVLKFPLCNLRPGIINIPYHVTESCKGPILN